MSPGDQISRRALFRKSLSSRLRQELKKPEPPPAPMPEESPVSPVTAGQVLKRIEAEPAYRLILPKLLDFCISPRSGSEIHDWMLRFPEMQTALHSPELLLSWMIQVGGIASCKDDAIPDLWQTTEVGRETLEMNDPSTRLSRLFMDEPAYVEIYRQILEFCVTARSNSEIEDLLRAHPALENPKVYPSYLIDRLETAGGLEWVGKWITADAGKLFLSSPSPI